MSINKYHLFLTFLVIVISGNPATETLGQQAVYIGALMIFVLVGWYKKFILFRQDLLILSLFFALTVAHVLIFGSISILASLGFLTKLCIAMFAVRLVPHFSRHYVLMMYILSLSSFVFWVPLFFDVDMRNFFSGVRIPIPTGDHYHIGIYNLRQEIDVSVRNMSMFWEPGAFAGYLILALYFAVRDSPGKLLISKKELVLIAALLSTQSSSGYIAFLVVIVFYACKMSWYKSRTAKLLIAPLVFVIFTLGVSVIFNQVSFLGEKINAQIESAISREDVSRINRFGNLVYDLQWIANRPILGWSANPATRFSADSELVDLIQGQGNGLTGFTIKFGLVGLFLYIGLLAYNTWNIARSKVDLFFGVTIICLLLNTQQFLNFPVFLSLIFLIRNTTTSFPNIYQASIQNYKSPTYITGRSV